MKTKKYLNGRRWNVIDAYWLSIPRKEMLNYHDFGLSVTPFKSWLISKVILVHINPNFLNLKIMPIAKASMQLIRGFRCISCFTPEYNVVYTGILKRDY